MTLLSLVLNHRIELDINAMSINFFTIFIKQTSITYTTAYNNYQILLLSYVKPLM